MDVDAEPWKWRTLIQRNSITLRSGVGSFEEGVNVQLTICRVSVPRRNGGNRAVARRRSKPRKASRNCTGSTKPATTNSTTRSSTSPHHREAHQVLRNEPRGACRRPARPFRATSARMQYAWRSAGDRDSRRGLERSVTLIAVSTARVAVGSVNARTRRQAIPSRSAPLRQKKRSLVSSSKESSSATKRSKGLRPPSGCG